LNSTVEHIVKEIYENILLREKEKITSLFWKVIEYGLKDRKFFELFNEIFNAKTISYLPYQNLYYIDRGALGVYIFLNPNSPLVEAMATHKNTFCYFVKNKLPSHLKDTILQEWHNFLHELSVKSKAYKLLLPVIVNDFQHLQTNTRIQTIKALNSYFTKHKSIENFIFALKSYPRELLQTDDTQKPAFDINTLEGLSNEQIRLLIDSGTYSLFKFDSKTIVEKIQQKYLVSAIARPPATDLHMKIFQIYSNLNPECQRRINFIALKKFEENPANLTQKEFDLDIYSTCINGMYSSCWQIKESQPYISKTLIKFESIRDINWRVYSFPHCILIAELNKIANQIEKKEDIYNA